jgi:tRNA A-37 threonylcarbamoyl transferase component Bud32
MTRARDSFIGPYRIEVKIGDGGMGVVYKCYDGKLKRFVALKILKEKYSGDKQYHERLQREAQAIASLSHPNIAGIYAIEEGNGLPPYLVMEYVEGSSAEALLERQGALDPAHAIAIVRATALGLKAALEKGIIHRDVKPSNILIGADNSVKIVDFGLAKIVEGARSITDDGIVLGTPLYISPEQGRGQKTDHRSDIYSLGATLYHLVTGRPPFEAETQVALIVAHLNDTPTLPHRVQGAVPQDLSLIIGKMMAKDPARRYAGYDELIGDLDRLTGGGSVAPKTASVGAATFRPAASPRQVPPRYWWAAAGAVALAVGATLITVRLLPPGPSSANRPERLFPGWVIRNTQSEGLDMSFSAPPGGLPWPEVVRSVFSLSRWDAGRAGVESPWLVFEALSLPAALRFPFRRLDEVGIRGLKIDGPADFAILIVHPDGPLVRSLTLALRAGSPGSRQEKTRSEEPSLEVIRAERNGDRVVLNPAPAPAPRLPAGGVYDVEAKFRPDGASGVRVHLSIRRTGGAGPGEVYSSNSGGEVLLPGNDWNQGLVFIWPSSPLLASSAAIKKLVMVGLMDREREISDYPWETQEGEDKPFGKGEHGEADRH